MKKYITLILICLMIAGCGELTQLIDDIPRLRKIDYQFNQGSLEAALKESIAYSMEYPKSYKSWCLLGWINLKIDNLEDAGMCFAKSIELNERWDNAYVGLGVIYRKQKDYQAARTAYLKAAQIVPRNAEAFSSLMVIEIIEKDYQKAVEYGERAWRFRKNLASIPANLAVAYHFLGNEEKKSFYYNQAKKLNYQGLDAVDKIFSGIVVIE